MPGADPAELLDPAGADEIVDGGGRLTDRRRGPAIRSGGVDVRAGEVEQPREGLEPVRYRRVVQATRETIRRGPGSVALGARGSSSRRSEIV